MQLINPGRRTVKERIPLVFGILGRDFFKGIPQHMIRATLPIYRKVTFKHATLGTKLFDRPKVIRPRCRDQLVGSGRGISAMPAKAVDGHSNTAQFRVHIGSLGQGFEVRLPLGVDRLPAA